jgi:hypothetical protein
MKKDLRRVGRVCVCRGAGRHDNEEEGFRRIGRACV